MSKQYESNATSCISTKQIELKPLYEFYLLECPCKADIIINHE